MIEITPLRPDDRAAWQPLAVGYNTFYERTMPDATYDHVWRRLMDGKELNGLAARLDGRVVGIAHFFFHTNVWVDEVCYLADLFVDEEVRGQGVARLLIEAIAERARQRYYWLTQQHNVRARGLYDQVARFVGFIRYDYPLNVPT